MRLRLKACNGCGRDMGTKNRQGRVKTMGRCCAGTTCQPRSHPSHEALLQTHHADRPERHRDRQPEDEA